MVPATRKDHCLFRDWLQDHPDPWKTTVHGRKSEKGQIYKLMESPLQSSDGFRIIWAWGPQKSRHDREIRNDMKKEGRNSIQIYPESRLFEPPTTDHVLDDFFLVQIYSIELYRKIVKKYMPKLTQRQEDLLRLAGVPNSEYHKD